MKSILIVFCIPIFGLCACTKKSGQKETSATKKVEATGKVWSASTSLEELGYHLYFDKRLSADNSISCNSCHDITNQKGGVDGLPTSVGINGQKGGRNAPTVWNAKFLSVQFWDGRAKDLADQAKGPITNPIEMGMENHEAAISKIKDVDGYKKLFAEAFKDQEDPINIENAAKAIAAFESTLITLNSPYDKGKMSAEAQAGFNTFKEVGCVSCHSGDHFAGPQLPIGTGFYMKFPTFPKADLEEKYEFSGDMGRYEVTENEADKHFYRVPTLRNIELTGPYFHNGRVNSLDEAVRVMGRTQLNKDLNAEEVNSIVAFLKSLTGELPIVQEAKTL